MPGEIKQEPTDNSKLMLSGLWAHVATYILQEFYKSIIVQGVKRHMKVFKEKSFLQYVNFSPHPRALSQT